MDIKDHIEAVLELLHSLDKSAPPATRFAVLNELAETTYKEEVVEGITYHNYFMKFVHGTHTLSIHLITNKNAYNFPSIVYTDTRNAINLELFFRSRKLIINPDSPKADECQHLIGAIQPVFNALLTII